MQKTCVLVFVFVSTYTTTAMLTSPAPLKTTPPAIQQKTNPATSTSCATCTTTPKKCTVACNIEEQDLGYRKFGTHYPTEFTLSINNKEQKVQNNGEFNEPQPITVEVADNIIKVKYYAQFKNGRESSKEYTFKVKPDVKNIELNFDWKEEPRMIIHQDHATFDTVEDLIK